jgi:OOP family OmpA-OmpF porin
MPAIHGFALPCPDRRLVIAQASAHNAALLSGRRMGSERIMTSRIKSGLLGLLLLLVMPAASAVDDYGGWYGTLMVSGIDEDANRGLETDWSGYHVGVGRGFGANWALELNHVGTRFKNRAGDEALVQWGFGLDATFRLAQTRYFTPYAVVGAGWLMSDYKLGKKDRDGAMASAGLGLLTPFGRRLAVRTELRARRDMSAAGSTDYLLSIGITLPFAYTNLGPPPGRADAPGTLLPEAGAAPFGWQADTDGDGVADLNDACPQTPAGASIDSRGCAPEDDADGDGVADVSDVCPDTPAGARVDKHGCMIAAPRQ